VTKVLSNVEEKIKGEVAGFSASALHHCGKITFAILIGYGQLTIENRFAGFDLSQETVGHLIEASEGM
jgi:hypothetical protein